MNEEITCLIDKKNEKWIVSKFYIDKKGIFWTILMSLKHPVKFKKLKGIV